MTSPKILKYAAWTVTIFCLVSAIGLVLIQFMLFTESFVVCDATGGTYHSAECKDVETTMLVLAPVTFIMLAFGAILPVSILYHRYKRKGSQDQSGA